jgi:hypothetical protein
VGGGFHAFGNHAAAERDRQAHHAVQNRQVFRVDQHVAHKTLVDLEHARGQVAQVVERRVAGAEIVEGKRHADLAAGHDHAGDLGNVAQGAGLQNFQLQIARLHLRVAAQQGAQIFHKSDLLNCWASTLTLMGMCRPCRFPGRDLPSMPAQHPAAQAHGKRVALHAGKNAPA